MDRKKGLGPVKRFGVRYGRTVKHRLAKVEFEKNSAHKCPYCSKPKVSRISYGIWECRKCGNKFTARAYTVGKPTSYVEEKEDLSAEFPEEKSKVADQAEEVEA